jgi:hypothetical protein
MTVLASIAKRGVCPMKLSLHFLLCSDKNLLRQPIHHWKNLVLLFQIGGLAPLQTGFSFFFETIFFGKKKMHMKNGENHTKEQNESFQMVYDLPSKFLGEH